MFTPVLPEIVAPRPKLAPSASLLRRRSSKRLTGLPEVRSESQAGGDSAASRKQPSNAVLTFQRSVRQITRHKSELLTTIKSVVTPETPTHLLKFLLKTPEQQQRLSAVKTILADEPSARNEMSLDVVYDWMLQNCKQYSNNIFGSAPEYIRREICRQMRLMKVMSQGLIIRQGDSGDRCYIVINGIVDVYIQKESELLAAGAKSGPDYRSSGAGESQGPELSNVKVYGDMVANLGPGAMFGEVVLLNPTAKRNATILASQYTDCCELICLERADYARLVRTASMEASHYNHAEILDQMYLFQGWEKHEKMRLVSAMRSMSFISNEYLYRAGSDAKWMFVVTSGEVVERLNWEVSGGSDALRMRLLARSSKAPEKKVNIELALVGPGDIAGELPFVTAKWIANFDIKAVTDVQTLAIDRRYYESNLLNATPETNRAIYSTLQKLKRVSREREDWRQQRLECGSAYPNAHISITWQLMRMSNLRCPRCGARGHLAVDAARCSNPPGGGPPTSSLAVVNGSQRKSRAAIEAQKRQLAKLAVNAPSAPSSRSRGSVLRELFDDQYLPTAKEQLARCRRQQQQRASPTPAALPQPRPEPSTPLNQHNAEDSDA